MAADDDFGALLRATAPDRLVEAADAYLREWYGVERVDVLLADYRISGLWPVLDGHQDPVGGVLRDRGASARCFAGQQLIIEDGRVFLPLTVWGERVGVLVLDGDDLDLDRLAETADELAIAIRAADRDTDRYRLARRRDRLTMAAEMQWDLLPGRSLSHPRFELAGQLEPAYQVAGDHFDWAVTGEKLTITVLNGYGGGLAASALSGLAINAMRNARRSGGDIVEQAELASDTVFAHHGGEKHVATLLLEADLNTGRVRAVDAGSPRAFRIRGPKLSPITLDQQLPLGMFGEARYATQSFLLEPGDRLFIVSDGVHAAAPGEREPFGEAAMLAAVRATRLQPPAEAVGSVMRGLQDYHDDADPDDDAVIVCLDWHGTD
ncbi:PP2C family protein-serine/threonine phosphatase [Catenuloplanes indicus]|uniref:Serine phosphatase RsbU (Regulator of sigma subunit) n=1 Tax=Catenuloplanes indicus TaxID=137267 RepID=A0AAE4B0K2_9ACTN|nr:PP2C family protein-serine/threonine phosphatase [Catenuloplanes indicus]MDQ0369662.1 serine phosphatase RsbU (regulator of sigma subunit) [Catenuloplanes indicus]